MRRKMRKNFHRVKDLTQIRVKVVKHTKIAKRTTYDERIGLQYLINKVAISPARVTNKHMLARKVALKIHFPGLISPLRWLGLGLDVLG